MLSDADLMARAISVAEGIGRNVSPNPGVGCAIQTADGHVFVGHTQPPGGGHAEIMALLAAAEAGVSVEGAALATTLEPCNNHGRTGPCTRAIIEAGIARVVVGLIDPDAKVSGQGIEELRAAGIDVAVGIGADAVREQLRFYLHHRRTGRPWVTLKLAASFDGRTAAPDGSSQWITSHEARVDAHRMRAEHDAILVGAGTVRADNPTLTVRHVDGPDPLRVVLGSVAPDALVNPCRSMSGPLDEVLRSLASDGVLSVLVEGGATVAHAFHAAGPVSEYVLYLAPLLFGGNDALSLFTGPGAASLDKAWRGAIHDVTRCGPDLRITLRPQ